MEAPLYPAAARFVPPVRQPRVLNTHDASVAELMAMPEVWARVVKDMPAITFATETPLMKPHLGNLSLRDLVMFGAAKADALDGIDAYLRGLGAVA